MNADLVHSSWCISQITRLLHVPYLLSSVLADDAAGKDDLYIRSVCFSPDGKYLATGAEDKQIRVSFASVVLNFTFSSVLFFVTRI